MRRAATIGGVAAAFAALGVANFRDGPAAAAGAATVQARLDAVPDRIGGWVGSPAAVEPGHLRVAEAVAHLSRTYRKGGTAVNVLVLYGEPGPLGAHTPDVCYRSAGFTQVGPERKRPVPGATAELWAARFDAPGGPARSLDVAWAWAGPDAGTWVAADNPRVAFAGHDRIFKLYLARNAPSAAPGMTDPDGEFARLFLGEFARCVTDDREPRGARTAPATTRP